MSRLKKVSTRAPKDFDKQSTKEKTAGLVEELNELQNLMYAEGRHSLLVIFQGMDASGKDGAVKNVFGRVNPLGVDVKPFKAPTEEELSHDFLWRVHRHTPAKGMIQVFNRSHYEDVLITRVHGWCSDEEAKRRFRAINDFERLLQDHAGTHVFKFYLHISPEEQQERLQERISDPTKNWKYNEKDFSEAKLWDRYMEMYEDAFENCNDPEWIIVPSDQNWYKEHLIAKTVVERMRSLNMKFPTLTDSSRAAGAGN